MLRLRDLFQLRQAETVLNQIVADSSGLVIVTGPEGYAGGSSSSPARQTGFLPSGRTMVFRTLVEELLETDPDMTGILVSETPLLNRSGRSWRRVRHLQVDDAHSYPNRIVEAAERQPSFILVDRLDLHSLAAALEMARRGMRIFAQLDSPLRGWGVVQYFRELGVSAEQLGSLTWIVSVQRHPTLCVECRKAVLPSETDLQRLERLLPFVLSGFTPAMLTSDIQPNYSDAPGCRACGFTGRRGDVAVLDVYNAQARSGNSNLLPMEACLWMLVQRGSLPLRDLLFYEQNMLQKVFQTLALTTHGLEEAQSALERTRSELEAATRVLNHRNQALFSFQDIGYALIRSDDLYDLANRICRRAGEICTAERVVLYYLRSDERVEVAAVVGWEGAQVHQQFDVGQVFRPRQGDKPSVFRGLPVGALAHPGEADEKSFKNLAGLFVPLVSQGERMGAIIIQAAQKPQFNQGEVAMLQAFANQAALALQRAVLVENLRKKIDALEAAQAGLAEKERIERELELARQVQQSVLPQLLPEIPGYRFLSRCEAARQVGGDFFDVMDLDEEHFGLAVADVSDKGMPAAMYMVLTRSLLVAQSQVERSPAKVLRSVNQLLNRLSTASMFVTVFYGVVHRPSGRLRYARAGHDRPVLHHQNQMLELPGDGIALGVLDDEHFLVDEGEVQLSPGDRLVLYTDGLCDVLNPNQELFGRANLLRLLEETVHQPLAQAGREIFQSLRHFQNSADQFDDMTLLMMDVIELTKQ